MNKARETGGRGKAEQQNFPALILWKETFKCKYMKS